MHHDPVGKRHRLDLVVGDENGGDVQGFLQPLDLDARLVAQLGIEVGKRLVEQEHLRFAHDGAADGDALALAARQLRGPPVDVGVEFQNRHGLRDPLLDLRLGKAGEPEPERHVLAHVMCG